MTSKAIKKTTAAETTVVQEEAPQNLSTTIVPQENSIVNFNVESLMAKAIEHGLSPETMEKFLAMRQQLKAEWAKEQYTRAMSNFQSQCPTIVKTKGVKTKSGAVAYKYAPIESIVEQVKPYLQENGFSYSTSMEVLPDGVRVVCKVTHIDGHSEESPMQVPLGTKTDIMSQSQVTAAAQTFAKRYAFCNAFGILTGDEDNDAAPVDNKTQQTTGNFPPSEKQIETIKKNMLDKGVTEEMLIDEGFDLKNLTGGNKGTASELIGYLFAYKPVYGQTPGGSNYTGSAGLTAVTEDDKAMVIFIKDLEACQSIQEWKQVCAAINIAVTEGKLSEPSQASLRKVAKKVQDKLINEGLEKEKFKSDNPDMQKMASAMELAKKSINKTK